MTTLRSPLRRALVGLLVLTLGAGAAMTATSAAVAAPAPPTITTPGGPLVVAPSDLAPTPTDLQVVVEGSLASPAIGGVARVQVREGTTVVASCEDSLGAGDTEFSCSVTNMPAGDYLIVAQHSDVPNPLAGDWSADSTAVELRVGGDTRVAFTGTVSGLNTWNTFAPVLTGEGPAYGSLTVIWTQDFGLGAGNPTGTYCVIPEIPRSEQWTCTLDAMSTWRQNIEWGLGVSFRIDNPRDVLNLTWPPAGAPVETGGRLLPDDLAVTASVGSSSFGVAATGPERTSLYAALYKPNVIPGEVYEFGFELDYCGADDGDIPVLSCSFTNLEPGLWNVLTVNDVSETVASRVIEDYVLIPEALTSFTAAVTPQRSVQFSGTGEPGHRAIVQTTTGQVVCSTIVSLDGSWQCTIEPGAGEFSYRALQQTVGFQADPLSVGVAARSFDGFSALSSVQSVTVPPPPPAPSAPPPAPAPPAVPAPPAAPAVAVGPISWTLDGYDGGPLQPGQTLNLSARGLPPQTDVVIEIRSTPQVLGAASADDLGAFALTVTVPEDLAPGPHTLVGIATPPGGVASEVAIPVTVIAVESAPSEGGEAAPEPVAAPDGDGRVTTVPGDRADPAAPSAISDSIPTIDRIFRTPLLVVTGGGLALALLLLVAFPAELLNNTIASNNRRIGRWYAALDDRLERATEWFARITRSRAIAAALLVTITAVIFGFVDPQYGFDPVSLRMTVSLALGLFVVTYVASWISGRIVQRVWGIPCRVGLQPAALLFAVVGVIIARILEFSPGFLIGLVIGLDVLARVGAPYRVKALVTNVGVTVALALLGWIGYSVLVGLATGEPGWAELLVRDAFVATAAEGLTAALASLLPLGFLAGHEIAKQSRWLWIACFGIVATLFALIVLPTADGETEAIDVGFWLAVMGGFAVVVLALWAVLHVTAGDDDADAEPVDPSASTVASTR